MSRSVRREALTPPRLTEPGALLAFVQLEFTHAIGLPIGAYAVLGVGDDPVGPGQLSVGDADSLLVEILEARSAPRRRRLGASREVSASPAEVALVVVTLVLASEPLADQAAADVLTRWRDDPALQRALVERALRLVNRGVRAYRAAALDPYVTEIMEMDPRAVRFGYGQPGEIGAGRWLAVFEMAADTPDKLGRDEQLRISEAVGAALAGRALLFEAEELALRALLDLRHGRPRAAAAQARIAVEVLREELHSWIGDVQVTAVETEDPEVIEATAVHVLETAAAYRTEHLRSTGLTRFPA